MTDATDTADEPSEQRTVLHNLVQSAFEQARATGKPDWHRMTTAVLKNRLLQQTDWTFDEKAFGAANVAELLEGLADLVLLDRSGNITTVELKTVGTDSQSTEKTSVSPQRVRPDLWHGVLDFRNGPWTWDAAERRAISQATNPSGPVLPTVSASELIGLRTNFAERLRSEGLLNQKLEPKLSKWATSQSASAALPSWIQTKWYEELQEFVTQRLQTWAATQGIDLPKDVVVLKSKREDKELATLRSFITRCVNVMTLEELRSVQIPATTAQKMLEHGSRPHGR